IEKILHNINDKMLREIAEKQLNFINNIKMHENIS
ncbi:ATP synthase epsilon chain 2, partial [Ehrlichia ruminantium]